MELRVVNHAVTVAPLKALRWGGYIPFLFVLLLSVEELCVSGKLPIPSSRIYCQWERQHAVKAPSPSPPSTDSITAAAEVPAIRGSVDETQAEISIRQRGFETGPLAYCPSRTLRIEVGYIFIDSTAVPVMATVKLLDSVTERKPVCVRIP